MDVGKSSGLKLLPAEEPEPKLLGSMQYSHELFDLNELPEAQRRVILWTLAIDEAFRWNELRRDTPGYKFSSCGFADPDTEGDAFGIFIYTEPDFRLKPYQKPISEFKVGTSAFPVFLRFATEVLHGVPSIHPINGTSACWAQSGKTALKGKTGFLTVKHVLQGGPGVISLGASVAVIQAAGIQGPATVLDLAPEGIDAALLAPPAGVQPGPLKPLNCPHFIAQWTDVSFQGVRSTVHTKVVEVQLGRGSLDPSIPLRIFLAHPGQPGDSGSLVQDNQGNGVGLYMGGLLNWAGHMEGYCQHLHQVAHVMNLNPSI